MAGLTMKGLVKVYPGDVHAVKGFDLEIEDREFIILVGPSGCGKSTVLRMVAGLEEITGGELFIGDRVVNKVAPKDRDIAMVFQNYALYPHMNVFNNMAFGLKMRGVPKAEIREKVEKTAGQLGITELLARRPKALSGGQRQRVALGRAMVRDPAVFLLDEPLSNLDAKLRTAMRAEITQLHRRLGTTFLYVTHDQTEAMTMADRIVVMKDGVIQQVDTPQNLYDHPVNLFVAGFIGSPQMNLLSVRVIREDGIALEREGRRIAITAETQEILRAHSGDELMLGVRPEHLKLCSEDDAGSLPGTVVLEERLGSETNLHVELGEKTVVVRTPPSERYRSGQLLHLRPDPAHMHLFDAETEMSLFAPDAVSGAA